MLLRLWWMIGAPGTQRYYRAAESELAEIPARTSCRGAAPEDRQVCAPRTNSLGILLRHDSHHLPDVSQVVRDPRREVLAERHHAEFGVPAATRQGPRR